MSIMMGLGKSRGMKMKRRASALALPIFCLSACAMYLFKLETWKRDTANISRNHVLSCPEQPAGSLKDRNKIDAGSPGIFLVCTDNADHRVIWRKYLLPQMSGLNFDAKFFIENSKKTDADAQEAKIHDDIVFFNVPPYSSTLAGFYYRAVEAYRWAYENKEKQYEWFIRPDTDAFYCLHHIRLELNAIDANKSLLAKPGVHWSHFYGDGDGGQKGIPVSDVHEALNRYAISKLLEYAPEAMHGGIWDINAVDVLGSNLADLSSNVTQIHDVRWAFGPGIDGSTYWNSGFLGYEFANECLCANWLAIHLGKKDLELRFQNISLSAVETQVRRIVFNRPTPDGAKFGSSPPYFTVGGCREGSKRKWSGCP